MLGYVNSVKYSFVSRQQQQWKMAAVMLDYAGEYCEAGDTCQSSVTVIMNSNAVLND